MNKPHECSYHECPYRAFHEEPVRAWIVYLLSQARAMDADPARPVEIRGIVLDHESFYRLKRVIKNSEIDDILRNRFMGYPIRSKRLHPDKKREIIVEVVKHNRPHTIEHLVADQPP